MIAKCVSDARFFNRPSMPRTTAHRGAVNAIRSQFHLLDHDCDDASQLPSPAGRTPATHRRHERAAMSAWAGHLCRMSAEAPAPENQVDDGCPNFR